MTAHASVPRGPRSSSTRTSGAMDDDLLARGPGAARGRRRRRLGPRRADADRRFRAGAARCDRDRQRRLALRRRPRRGVGASGRSSRSPAAGPPSSTTPGASARDPRALGRAGVRRRGRGDGARPGARVQPRHRRRRPGHASRRASAGSSAADGLGNFLALRQARRVRRLREHRPSAARALLEPFGCEVSRLRPVADRRLPPRQEGSSRRLSKTCCGRVACDLRARDADAARTAALLSRELLELRRARTPCSCSSSRAHVVDFDALTELVLAGRFRAAIDVFPAEPLDPEHPIRQAPARRALAAQGGASSQEALLGASGRVVVDDLEAIVRGLPPRRMQVAEPELATRYVRTTQLVACRAGRAGSDLVMPRRRRARGPPAQRHGRFVKPSQRLYPWQWNWDSAFVVIGLAGVDPERARARGALAARGPMGRRHGPAHGLPPPAGRLPAGAGALGLGRLRRRARGRDERPDRAAGARDRRPDAARGRSRRRLPRGGRAEARRLARVVPSRAHARRSPD